MLRVLRKPLDIDELAERAADAPEAAFAGATIAS
jgi:hypothetical protein